MPACSVGTAAEEAPKQPACSVGAAAKEAAVHEEGVQHVDAEEEGGTAVHEEEEDIEKDEAQIDGQVESGSDLEMEEENDGHRFKSLGLGGIGNKLGTMEQFRSQDVPQEHSLTFGGGWGPYGKEASIHQDNVKSFDAPSKETRAHIEQGVSESLAGGINPRDSEIPGSSQGHPTENENDRNHSKAIPVPENIAVDNPEWTEKLATFQRKNGKKKKKEASSNAQRRSQRHQEGNENIS